MSDILSSFVSYLMTRSEVTALLAARVYPMAIPAGSTSNPMTMPCMTYQLIDEPAVTAHGGQVIYKARVQVDCYGSTYKSARGLADVVHGVLHGFSGAWGTMNVNVFRKRKQDLNEPDANLVRVTQDFIINYHE